MFRRRTPQQTVHRVREFLWPRAGWRRWGSYLLHRVKRLPGSPHAIAAGLAAGAAVSCMPLPGLHFLLGFGLAYVTRGSLIASAIGTAFGNPWTFPLLWSLGHRVGAIILPQAAVTAAPMDGPPAELQSGGLVDALLSLDAAYLTDVFLPVWWPVMVGSLPVSAAVWVAVYLPIRSTIAAHRDHRQRRRMARTGHP